MILIREGRTTGIGTLDDFALDILTLLDAANNYEDKDIIFRLMVENDKEIGDNTLMNFAENVTKGISGH